MPEKAWCHWQFLEHYVPKFICPQMENVQPEGCKATEVCVVCLHAGQHSRFQLGSLRVESLVTPSQSIMFEKCYKEGCHLGENFSLALLQDFQLTRSLT